MYNNLIRSIGDTIQQELKMTDILNTRKLAIKELDDLLNEYHELVAHEQGLTFFGYVAGILKGLLISGIITEEEAEEINSYFEDADKGYKPQKPYFIKQA